MKRISLLRLLYLPVAICIVIAICTPLTFAKESFLIPIIRERALPEDFSFSIHPTPTEHTFFEQAVAQDDGTFAICARFTNTASEAFSRVYVDVFESNGAFWKELSFSTQFEVTIELKGRTLILYFYDYIITVDLITEDVKCFEIAPNALRESGLYSSLHQDQFTSGEWEYRCKKSIWGYSELVRRNGEQEQILVSYSGIESFVIQNIISVVIVCISFFVLLIVMYRYINYSHKR